MMQNEDVALTPEAPNEVPHTTPSTSNTLDMESDDEADSGSNNVTQITENANQGKAEVLQEEEEEEEESKSSPVQPESEEDKDREDVDCNEVNSQNGKENQAEENITPTSQPESPDLCAERDSSDMESKDCEGGSEDTLHSPATRGDKEVTVPLTSQSHSPNIDMENNRTGMESTDWSGIAVNRPNMTKGEGELISSQSNSPDSNLERSSTVTEGSNFDMTSLNSADTKQAEETNLPSPGQLNSETSEDIKGKSYDITLTPKHFSEHSPAEALCPSPTQPDTHSNTNMEGETQTDTDTNRKSPVPSPMETAVPLSLAASPTQPDTHSNMNMEGETQTDTEANRKSPVPSPMETAVPLSLTAQSNSNSPECNDCAPTSQTVQDDMLSPAEAIVPVKEDKEEVMAFSDGSLYPSPQTPIPANTNLQESDSQHQEGRKNSGEVRSERKVRRGIKRKTPSASKGIQTSIHLLDSNSVFRDRIVDLQMLKREAGVVCVENLQDLDVAFEEWPILLVNQLKLRDTIIESLNSVIRELVGHGQVLEQDLDYLKLKILELQQEAKKKAKENQQKTHKTPGREAESQTTEEDLTEAWSRWYYGCWGDYYSECDPSSSSYWPGHYTQQSTVPSKAKDEETQQKTVEEEQKGAEETQAVNLEEEKETKTEDPSYCKAKSDDTKPEKRKKLKAKRKKERHKSDKSSKDPTSKERVKEERTEKSERRRKKAEKKRDERREESDDSTTNTSTAPHTELPQEYITSNKSTKEMNGKEEAGEEEQGKGKSLGWDTSESITEQVVAVAAQAVAETGYVFQEELGLYYDYNTGYYYNAENGLYYDTKSGTYFYYDHSSQSYQFHSQVSPTDASVTKRHKKKKADKKEKSKSSSKSEESREKEDGELTESDKEEPEEGEESESEGEKGEEDLTSPDHHEEEGPPAAEIPPSLRLMVVEGGERVRVGELHVVTLNGGTVGRESSNAVHLPDLNVSKMHAEIEYRSSGPEDHHYFIRDVGSNNGTFVNNARLSEARQMSSEVELGHGWEVMFGSIKVKCHLHPGTLTCNECEPGLVLQNLPSQSEGIASYKNAKCKEKARRKELKAMQKKYKLTQQEVQAASSAVAPGYTDRTLLRQTQKGSDNPYEKTEVASSEVPLRETNRGFTMLQKMGWSKGQGLGKDNTGRKDPIHQVSVVGKTGLGCSQPSAPQPDTWTERRKKQLQITQERFNQL